MIKDKVFAICATKLTDYCYYDAQLIIINLIKQFAEADALNFNADNKKDNPTYIDFGLCALEDAFYFMNIKNHITEEELNALGAKILKRQNALLIKGSKHDKR